MIFISKFREFVLFVKFREFALFQVREFALFSSFENSLFFQVSRIRSFFKIREFALFSRFENSLFFQVSRIRSFFVLQISQSSRFGALFTAQILQIFIEITPFNNCCMFCKENCMPNPKPKFKTGSPRPHYPPPNFNFFSRCGCGI